ncbi:hypothetical protein ZIOFF_036133 [Zingiber officinale]|uniref:Pentatricopeptide repeat-containing protein n=1 Tax=Zingiber officinale TaxID=94328 RepID=A0A8J5GHQ2_ZINOF|nr:hypothetical protein ZIOFF_036133 [Zingiber officinale]
MRQKSIAPDAYTFQFMFKSCGLAGSALEGQMVHTLFVKHFAVWNAFVANSLVYILIANYAKDGRASEAIGVFKEMMSENVEPDTVAMHN